VGRENGEREEDGDGIGLDICCENGEKFPLDPIEDSVLSSGGATRCFLSEERCEQVDADASA
jgi:hypothetical protein